MVCVVKQTWILFHLGWQWPRDWPVSKATQTISNINFRVIRDALWKRYVVQFEVLSAIKPDLLA